MNYQEITMTKTVVLDREWKFDLIHNLCKRGSEDIMTYQVYHYNKTKFLMYLSLNNTVQYEEYPTRYFLPDERDRMLVIIPEAGRYMGHSLIVVAPDMPTRDMWYDTFNKIALDTTS